MDAADKAQAMAALRLFGSVNGQGEVIPDQLTRATPLIGRLEEALRRTGGRCPSISRLRLADLPSVARGWVHGRQCSGGRQRVAGETSLDGARWWSDDQWLGEGASSVGANSAQGGWGWQGVGGGWLRWPGRQGRPALDPAGATRAPFSGKTTGTRHPSPCAQPCTGLAGRCTTAPPESQVLAGRWSMWRPMGRADGGAGVGGLPLAARGRV